MNSDWGRKRWRHRDIVSRDESSCSNDEANRQTYRQRDMTHTGTVDWGNRGTCSDDVQQDEDEDRQGLVKRHAFSFSRFVSPDISLASHESQQEMCFMNHGGEDLMFRSSAEIAGDTRGMTSTPDSRAVRVNADPAPIFDLFLPAISSYDPAYLLLHASFTF